jgi:hypothetical protein
LFIVAYTRGDGRQQRCAAHDNHGQESFGNDVDGRDSTLAHTDGERLRIERKRVPGGRPGDLRARRDAEPLDDSATGGRQAEPRLGGSAARISGGLDPISKELIDDASEADALEIVRALRRDDGPQAVLWSLGGLGCIPAPPLLRRAMLGLGVEEARAVSRRAEEAIGLASRSEVRDLRHAEQAPGSSRQQGPRGQPQTQPHDALRVVSHALALAARQAEAVAFQGWPARPGAEQYDWEPSRCTQEKDPYRRKRLAALGNAVVPQVAELVGRCVMDIIALERRGPVPTVDIGTHWNVTRVP